jgi:hypothetical protein
LHADRIDDRRECATRRRGGRFGGRNGDATERAKERRTERPNERRKDSWGAIGRIGRGTDRIDIDVESTDAREKASA